MALNPTLHKNILIRILKDIYENNKTGPILGFKGGTAAYLFYDLNRFSVDLDFDLLSSDKEQIVFENVKLILENYGSIKQADKKRYSLFFLLSYDQKLPEAQNIKIEINLRNFNSKYELKSYLGISMKVMTEKDMFAHKLCAMFERLGKTNRDIYDVWFFLNKNWPINEEIIISRTKLKYSEFIEKCISALENMSNQRILSGLGELLNKEQKVWVKSKLLKETIFLLKLRLDEIKTFL